MRLGTKTWPPATTCLLALLVLTGCQQPQRPAVSHDEAKKISAEFESASFEAPPRTVADVEALLDENAQTNWTRLNADRGLADSAPPPTAGPRDQALFYRNRAKAALYVGRYTQARRDLNLTPKTLRSFGIHETDNGSLLNEAHVHADLAHAEQFSGRLSKWHYHTMQRLKVSERQGHDSNPSIYSAAAITAAAIGRLDEAAAHLKTVKWKLPNTYESNSPFATITDAIAVAAEGRLLDLQGRHAEAEGYLRRNVDMIRRDRSSGKDPNYKPLRYSLAEAWDIVEIECLNWLSESLLGQGRLSEAELAARGSIKLSLARFGRYSPYTARALNSLNRTVIAQGRFADSRRLNRAIFEILEKVGVPPGAWERARVQADMAANRILNGDWPRAHQILGDLRDEMEKADAATFQTHLRGDPNYGLTLIKSGAAIEAANTLVDEHARKLELLGAKHYLVAELGGLLAMARAALGETEAALAGFRAAVPILLQRSRAVAGVGALQRFRRARILEAYLDLLAERGLAAEAFPIADALKGSTVQSAMAAAAARAAARDPELADLVRREQDAQKQVAALPRLRRTGTPETGAAQ